MADMPGRYRRPLHLAALQMEQGVCPSQAMDQCRAFPELACRLIRAGEQTGNLEGLCRVLADFYETKGKERRLLVQALAYPAFLLVCLILLTQGRAFSSSCLYGYDGPDGRPPAKRDAVSAGRHGRLAPLRHLWPGRADRRPPRPALGLAEG